MRSVPATSRDVDWFSQPRPETLGSFITSTVALGSIRILLHFRSRVLLGASSSLVPIFIRTTRFRSSETRFDHTSFVRRLMSFDIQRPNQTLERTADRCTL